MAENKKSKAQATETTEKVMTKYDKKVQKRKEEEAKAKKLRLRNRIIAIVVAVLAVAFVAYFPIRKFIATQTAYIEVGGDKVTEVEFEYYYNSALGNFVNENAMTILFGGMDPYGDLTKQNYTENITWDEYFQSQAVNQLIQTKALVKDAKSYGFTYDTTEDMEKYLADLDKAAADAGISVKRYVAATYGKFATVKKLKPIVEEAMYAAAFYEEMTESKKTTDEKVLTTYYEANKDSFDSVDYRVIEVAAEFPEAEEDEDVEITDEQIKEAMKEAKKKAEDLEKKIEKEAELQENAKKASLKSVYRDWLFSADRKEGETTIIEETSFNKYHVVQFLGRYLDDTNSVNMRVIMTTNDYSDAILKEWESTGADEEAFIALVKKYSEDSTSKAEGGLYENINATSLAEESITEWLLAEDRKAGDVEAISTEQSGYYVLYYVGEGQPEWQQSVQATLLSQAMETYLTNVTADVTVEDSKGKLTYEEAFAAEEAKSAE
ncbi:MAG: hypothetical protein E7293_08685 [Lachnospiraceae bacterium]|nr:hypothetical protein [Lachnospiraceae bacterium]